MRMLNTHNFNKERFIGDCIEAHSQGQDALKEVVQKAVAHPKSIISELGEPQHAGISPLYRSKQLTIINFAWAPCMSLMPHNHQMAAIIGVYSGREDNIFWNKTDSNNYYNPNGIETISAQSLGCGDVASLERDAIHSVNNPIGKMTSAIHVYSGDFFAPDTPRSEWDHETLTEQPWDIEKVKCLFAESEARFNAITKL